MCPILSVSRVNYPYLATAPNPTNWPSAPLADPRFNAAGPLNPMANLRIPLTDFQIPQASSLVGYRPDPLANPPFLSLLAPRTYLRNQDVKHFSLSRYLMPLAENAEAQIRSTYLF